MCDDLDGTGRRRSGGMGDVFVSLMRTRATTTCSLATIFEERAASFADESDFSEDAVCAPEDCLDVAECVKNVQKLLSCDETKVAKAYLVNAESRIPDWSASVVLKEIMLWATMGNDPKTIHWVIRRMADHDVEMETADFNAMLDKRANFDVVRSVMAHCGCEPNVSTFCQVLRASAEANGGSVSSDVFMNMCADEVEDMLGKTNKKAAKIFLATLVEDFPEFPTGKFLTIMVEDSAAAGKDALAEWAVRRMADHKVCVDVEKVTAIITKAGKAGNKFKVWDMVQTLKRLVPENPETINTSEAAESLKTMARSLEDGVKGKAFKDQCCTDVQSILASLGQEETTKFLSNLDTELSDFSLPEFLVYMLEAVASSGNQLATDFCVDAINREKIEITLTMFNAMMANCAEEGNTEGAQVLKTVMTSCGCEPDVITFIQVLKGQAKAMGDSTGSALRDLCVAEITDMIQSKTNKKAAKVFLSAMGENISGFSMSEFLLGLLEECALTGKEILSEWCVRRILDHKVPITTATFNSMMSGMAMAGDLESMQILKRMMPLCHCESDVRTFILILRARASGDVKSKDFIEMCVNEVADMVTSKANAKKAKLFLTTLLAEYPEEHTPKELLLSMLEGSAGISKEAVSEWCVRRMNDYNVETQTSDFNAMMDNAAQTGNAGMVEILRRMMVQCKCDPDASTLLRILEVCALSSDDISDDAFIKLCSKELMHMVGHAQSKAAKQFLAALSEDYPDCDAKDVLVDMLRVASLECKVNVADWVVRRLMDTKANLKHQDLVLVLEAAAQNGGHVEILRLVKEVLHLCKDKQDASIFCLVLKASAQSSDGDKKDAFNKLCMKELEEMLGDEQRSAAKSLLAALSKDFPEFGAEECLCKLLRKFCRNGDDVNGVWVASRISNLSIVLGTTNFNALFGNPRTMRATKVLVRVASTLKVDIDVTSLLGFIEGCANADDYDWLERKFREMVRISPRNTRFYAQLVEAYLLGGNEEYARMWAVRAYDACIGSNRLAGDLQAAERWFITMAPRPDMRRAVGGILEAACLDAGDRSFARYCYDRSQSASGQPPRTTDRERDKWVIA